MVAGKHPLFALSCMVFFTCHIRIDASNNSLRGQSQRAEQDILLSAAPPTDRRLIIGGDPAQLGDYPYFSHMEGIACGGSLIAPDVVLTAGHVSACFIPRQLRLHTRVPNRVSFSFWQCKLATPKAYGKIHVGRHSYRMGGREDDAELFKVTSHYRHPNYVGQLCCGFTEGVQFNGVSHDFMLLKLDGESTKQVVSLETSSDRPTDGEELYVMGFGDIHAHPNIYVEPDRLFEVTVNYVPNEMCAATSIYPLALLPEETLCATDKRQDGCQGDSGGPLVIKGDDDSSLDDVQVGLVSWGWGCAEQPGVYARISEGYPWIREQVCSISENPPASFNCTTKLEAVEQPQSTQQQQRTESPQETNKPSFGGSIIHLADKNNNTDSPSNYFTSSTRPRSSLPSGTPCRTISDPQVCCASRDSSSTYRDQMCVPAPSGQTFSTGSTCEPVSWVKENGGEQISRLSLQEGVCDAIIESRKIKLPKLSSCQRMFSNRACCMAQDVDGNPCIPSKGLTRFSTGSRCETAMFVVQNQPENAGTCSL
jgi:trypsin